MTEQSNILSDATENLSLNNQKQLNSKQKNLVGLCEEERGDEKPVPPEILHLLDAILLLQSPDDLQVHTLAAQIRSITNEADYRWLCSHICSGGSSSRQAASVVAAVCRETASHAVGAIKMRSLLFRTAQALYDEHEHVSRTDHAKFVTGTLFLGELFYYVKSEAGSPFAVLAEPLVTMLNKILQKHLQELSSQDGGLSTQHPCSKSAPPNAVEARGSSSVALEASCPESEAGQLPPEDDGEAVKSQLNGDLEGVKSDTIESTEETLNTKVDLPENSEATNDQDDVAQSSQEKKDEGGNGAELCEASEESSSNPAIEGSKSVANSLDEDVMVVARQLLQNGDWLLRLCPAGVTGIVLAITELMCRSCLSSTATLQVAAALAEMWPLLSVSVHPRTSHAVLAARMGLSLNL